MSKVSFSTVNEKIDEQIMKIVRDDSRYGVRVDEGGYVITDKLSDSEQFIRTKGPLGPTVAEYHMVCKALAVYDLAYSGDEEIKKNTDVILSTSHIQSNNVIWESIKYADLTIATQPFIKLQFVDNKLVTSMDSVWCEEYVNRKVSKGIDRGLIIRNESIIREELTTTWDMLSDNVLSVTGVGIHGFMNKSFTTLQKRITEWVQGNVNDTATDGTMTSMVLGELDLRNSTLSNLVTFIEDSILTPAVSVAYIFNLIQTIQLLRNKGVNNESLGGIVYAMCEDVFTVITAEVTDIGNVKTYQLRKRKAKTNHISNTRRLYIIDVITRSTYIKLLELHVANKTKKGNLPDAEYLAYFVQPYIKPVGKDDLRIGISILDTLTGEVIIAESEIHLLNKTITDLCEDVYNKRQYLLETRKSFSEDEEVIENSEFKELLSNVEDQGLNPVIPSIG